MWLGQRLDDSLFESMLTPLTKNLLEGAFLDSTLPSGSLSGFFVFHRELGLILQNEESKRLFPKATLNSPWERVERLADGAITPPMRVNFRNLFESGVSSGMELFDLLPNRIGDADTLFLWTKSWNWGRALFLCALEGKERGGALRSVFQEKAARIDPILDRMMEDWMLDSTLEVFWSRIMKGMPPEHQPVPGELSPGWYRTIPLNLPVASGNSGIGVLRGHYLKGSPDGWTRSVEKLERPGGGFPPAHGRNVVGGREVVVPLNLWGLFDLGSVTLPAGLIRKTSGPFLISRLRKSRALSMHSLYRHLLYEGKLMSLSYWLSHSECFGIGILDHAEEWLGPEVLEDTLLEVKGCTEGSRKRIEDRLRPFDLILADEDGSTRIVLLLRKCTGNSATRDVIPRLMKGCGVTGEQFGPPLSVREFLAAKGG